MIQIKQRVSRHLCQRNPFVYSYIYNVPLRCKWNMQSFSTYKKPVRTIEQVLFINRGRRTRTLDIWFWRPTFYRLNYTPTSSPSRVRTYDPPVNSRMLYRWAIEDHFYFVSGSHLLSRAVSSQVSSAACVLTVVFGMGTGVSHRRIATGNSSCSFKHLQNRTCTYFINSITHLFFGQALDLLVSVS